ncbi:mannitol dehydrogenase family protein [Marinimicrobium sp. ABcell2]|uniref:mannitol dehydrogenase family protein n=1 Tax=Marinimicrobium sp. ABcell2 TaxID=3069751 RepID=UPI0027B12C02|nr:mannitol dehydrogenase family protein [Marinimicrobium sp. ABcell2]MDQ2076035.1 mannitol dehydrogenase family protein [Marinimicrobium sp. ABcell2]
MNRLSNNSMAALPADVQVPTYNRAQMKTGIVHLGIGAFHRAHQAFYTEAVLNRFGGDWGILGASLRSPTVREQLAPQDGLYTLVERATDGERLQVIGAVQSVLVGPEDPSALVAAMASPEVKIVSLTVTEKGYCHDPATGNLNLNNPDIIHDLNNIEKPRTAVGYLVAALQKRQQAGLKSFTALSCDNLPDNGEVLEKVVLQFARELSTELMTWIQENTCFPCTMIDRIVPATTDADRDQLAERIGLRDEGVVVAEPFTQWVIEDRFVDGRPAWEQVGAQLVSSVSEFEKIKLRLLNGSHSTLAYAGYLSGFDYISEVMREPAFEKLIATFMAREAGETVSAPEGFDLEHYQEQLRERFRNTALKHRTWQIAMDGSQKLPQRLLQTAREQLRGGGHIDIICLAVAAWIRYVSGVDEQGNAIEVSDPLANRLRAACDKHKGDAAGMVKEVLSITEVFGTDLRDEAVFVETTTNCLQQFYQQGVLNTVRKHFD